MNAREKETSNTPVYSTPGLFRMERLFDEALATGTFDSRSLIETFVSSGLRRNITEHQHRQPANYLNYFYFLQRQAFEASGLLEYTYFGGLAPADVTSSARAELPGLKNQEVAKRTREILDGIEAELRGYDTAALPPVSISELEDESVLVEWVFDHFRTGFNLDVNPEESGYFLISDRLAGEIRNSGYLKGLRLRPLVRSLLTLILNN